MANVVDPNFVPPKDLTVTLENVRLIFRNFSGAEGPFNREGDRSTGVVLSPEIGQELADQGWNVKVLKPRDPEGGDEETYYLPVAVSYKIRPPQVFMLTQRRRTALTEDTIGTLDWATILNVDLTFKASIWTVNGKSGPKAYLQALYATVELDALAAKYENYGDHE